MLLIQKIIIFINYFHSKLLFGDEKFLRVTKYLLSFVRIANFIQTFVKELSFYVSLNSRSSKEFKKILKERYIDVQKDFNRCSLSRRNPSCYT